MKKIIWIATLLVTLCCFFGCGSPKKDSKIKQWMQDTNRLRVLCTTAQIGDLVTQVGGDKVHVWVLIQGDLDPHSYELVKGDDEKIYHADLIFYNGLNLEHGASLSAALQKSDKSCALGDKIRQEHPEKILMKGSAIDPHIWMDVSLWKNALDPIVQELSSKTEDARDYYVERARRVRETMDAAHLALQKKMHAVPEHKRYLLTSHDAFRYFARAYLSVAGEEHPEGRFAAPEGLAPDGQLSSRDIQRMIDFLRERRITILFPESNVSPDSIRKIADAGADLKLDVQVCNEPLYGDAMGDMGYLEMMDKNVDVMVRYLQ